MNRVACQDCPLAVPVDVLYALEVDEADDETAMCVCVCVCVCVRVRDGAADLQRKRKKRSSSRVQKGQDDETKWSVLPSLATSVITYALVPGAALRVLQDPLHIC